jgi:hypothetical protein
MTNQRGGKKGVVVGVSVLIVIGLVVVLYPFLMSRYVAYQIHSSLKSVNGIYTVPSTMSVREDPPANYAVAVAGEIELKLPPWTLDDRVIPNATIFSLAASSSAPASVVVFEESGMAIYDSLKADTVRFASESAIEQYYGGVNDFSNYGFVSYIANLTPDSIQYFKSKARLESDISLLNSKTKLFAGYPEKFFTNQYGVRGFTAPVEGGQYVIVFSEDDRPQEMLISGAGEELLAQILGNITFK